MTRLPTVVLVLGKPDAGKTHYGAVLIEKLLERRSSLSLAAAPADLGAFRSARKAIQSGKTAEHTNADDYLHVNLPVRLPSGEQVIINWPDYGGERLTGVAATRSISKGWTRQLLSASAWLVMIRPSKIERKPDLIDDLTTDQPHAAENRNFGDSRWDEGAWWTELFQLLLDVAGYSLVERLRQPSLAVVLSCWDELEDGEKNSRPSDLLREKAPLFADFVESNWTSEACSVWAISSLGRSLSATHEDWDYADRGPAAEGYAVSPDGKTVGLDEPLLWLLSQRAK